MGATGGCWYNAATESFFGCSSVSTPTGVGGPHVPTLAETTFRCNKTGCRCMADPPQLHGPCYQWTRKIDGRTRTTLLTAEQLDRYRPWFDNAKSIRALTAEGWT